MRKKSPRRGGKWRLLTEKGRRFVCVLGFMTAAATVVGWVWTARGGGEAPPVAGSRAEPQAEIVKCFDRCRRKETRSRGSRPHPGGEIGKVESGCGCMRIRIRCRYDQLPSKDTQLSDRARLCGNFPFILNN